MLSPTQWVPDVVHSLSWTQSWAVPEPQDGAQWVKEKIVCPPVDVVRLPQHSMPPPQSAVWPHACATPTNEVPPHAWVVATQLYVSAPPACASQQTGFALVVEQVGALKQKTDPAMSNGVTVAGASLVAPASALAGELEELLLHARTQAAKATTIETRMANPPWFSSDGQPSSTVPEAPFGEPTSS